MGLLTVEAEGIGVGRGALAVWAVARDMSRTSNGRTCFPSEFV